MVSNKNYWESSSSSSSRSINSRNSFDFLAIRPYQSPFLINLLHGTQFQRFSFVTNTGVSMRWSPLKNITYKFALTFFSSGQYVLLVLDGF